MAIDPRRINREMRGFLDLVRAKVGGSQPQNFDSAIKTQIDAIPFLAASQMVTKSASATGTGTQDTEIDVPADEAWLVYQLGAFWEGASTSLATAAATGYLAIGNTPTSGGGGTADAILGNWDWVGTLVGGSAQQRSAQFVWTPPGHFVLPPSSSVLNKNQAKASTVSCTSRVYALYTPLKV